MTHQSFLTLDEGILSVLFKDVGQFIHAGYTLADHNVITLWEMAEVDKYNHHQFPIGGSQGILLVA